MRKIMKMTAAMALCAVSVGASAQDVTVTQVTSRAGLTAGWYQIKCEAPADVAGAYICTGEELLYSRNCYPLFYNKEALADKPAQSFLYVTPLADTQRYTKNGVAGYAFQLQMPNGHYVQHNATTSRTALAGTSRPLLYDTNGHFRIVTNAAKNDYANCGWPIAPVVTARPTTVGMSSNDPNCGAYIHSFYKVDVSGYDIYTVSFVGDPAAATYTKDDATVTCTNAANLGLDKVYVGGKFFFPRGTVVSASDFTPDASHFSSRLVDISVDNTAKTVTVKSMERTAAQALIEKAKAACDMVGKVGYPSTVTSAMEAAISAAQTNLTAANVFALQEALADWSVTNVVLPEDGKAYTLRNVHPGVATDRYLTLTGTTWGLTPVVEGQPAPLSAVFVFHKLPNGKYILLNNEGYFASRYSTNITKTYNAQKDSITFRKLTKANEVLGHEDWMGSALSDADLVGFLSFYNYRDNNQQTTFIANVANTLNQAGITEYYNATVSTAFVVEEVAYPNKVLLRRPSAQDEGDNKAYASLYLPFATKIPAGVSAYTGSVEASSEVEGRKELAMNPLTGYLPANTAVVLTAEAEGEYTFIPTETTVAAVTDNALSGTVVANTPVEENTYILNGGSAGTDEHGIGFYLYNGAALPEYKAVLVNPVVPGTTLAVNKFSLNFGGATGITAAPTAVNGKREVYDLSGRRVSNPSAGIYIVNGKKVFINK